MEMDKVAISATSSCGTKHANIISFAQATELFDKESIVYFDREFKYNCYSEYSKLQINRLEIAKANFVDLCLAAKSDMSPSSPCKARCRAPRLNQHERSKRAHNPLILLKVCCASLLNCIISYEKL